MPPSNVSPRYPFTFWPSKLISRTPFSARPAISARTSSSGRETSSPRVYGTTQKEQYLEQPSIIETNALKPSTRGSGKKSNFSISGNEISTSLIFSFSAFPLVRDVDQAFAVNGVRFVDQKSCRHKVHVFEYCHPLEKQHIHPHQ